MKSLLWMGRDCSTLKNSSESDPGSVGVTYGMYGPIMTSVLGCCGTKLHA